MSPARRSRRPRPRSLRAQHRHGGDQRLRIGMLRGRVDHALLGDLDDLAEIHHRDPVGDVLHHAEIMGDEQIGEAELASAGPAAD